MKRYDVVKTFIDKNTKKKHKKGTKYRADDERAKGLKVKGFIADEVSTKKKVDVNEPK